MADTTISNNHTLAEVFLNSHPYVAIALVEKQPTDKIAQYIGEVSLQIATKLMEGIRPEIAAAVLQILKEKQAVALIESLDRSMCSRILSQLGQVEQEDLLEKLKNSTQKDLRKLLSYPFDSAGHLMTPQVLTFRKTSTISEVIERIRSQHGQRVYDLFVIDTKGKLYGSVTLQKIVTEADEVQLESLIQRVPHSVNAMATREEVVELFETKHLTSLPVIDIDQNLLGVIYHDEIVRVAEDEAAADIQSMVGASKEERALSKITFAVRKRLPWLQINLGTAFLSAAVVGIFEETIAQFTALAVLLPVVAGQSGNTGAQSLAVTMRGLAIREIGVGHWPKITYKEASVATINGIAVSVVTSLAVFLWSQSIGLCLIIGTAMILSMAIAGVAGAVIPIILSAVGQDPAQSSSIILTTVTDIAGFFSFLTLATIFSSMI